MPWDHRFPTPATQDDEFKAMLKKGIELCEAYAGDEPDSVKNRVIPSAEDVAKLKETDLVAARAKLSAEDAAALDNKLADLMMGGASEDMEHAPKVLELLLQGADLY